MMKPKVQVIVSITSWERDIYDEESAFHKDFKIRRFIDENGQKTN